jgi:type II secretion system protein N
MKRTAAVLAVLVLLGVFLAARFPWERLLPSLLATARATTGAEIQLADLGLGLGWSGPRLVGRDLVLRWPGSPALALEAVTLRPAWSLGWLRGRPAWYVEASGTPGAWRGELALDRIAGELAELDVAALPWVLLGSPAPLQGRISGSVDLTRVDGSWRGSAELEGQPGSVDLAGLPVAIPYQQLMAQLEIGAAEVKLAQARLQGPLVTASFAGTASPAGGAFASWPLDLQVEIEQVDPALRGYLAPLGISTDPQGRSHLRVTGTLAAPFLSGGTR